MLQEKAPRSIETQLQLLNDLTNPQERAHAFGMTINTNPCTTRSFPHKRLKISTTKYSKDTSNLDLTREHARQGLASTTSHLKRKHATTKTSRTQHRNAHLHWLDGLTNPQERARRRADDQHCTTRICSYMNLKIPIYKYFKTFLSSPSPENMHTNVSHQERLVTSASTPRAKASRIMETQSHRLHGMRNLQQRSGFVLTRTQRLQQSTLSRTISRPRPHRKICTLRSSIENLSLPALAHHQQKHHTALERNHTTSTA